MGVSFEFLFLHFVHFVIVQCFADFWCGELGLSRQQIHRIAVDNGANMIAGLRDHLDSKLDEAEDGTDANPEVTAVTVTTATKAS